MITLTINAATLDEARAQFNAFFTSNESGSIAPPTLKFPTLAAPVAPSPVPPQMTAPPAAPPHIAAPMAPAAPVPAAPATPPMPTAPVAPPPTYMEEDLSRAAAALIDSGKMADLQALLQTFGIRFVGELPAERYGEFAAALRNMGAKL